jgi:hypothetical protein
MAFHYDGLCCQKVKIQYHVELGDNQEIEALNLSFEFFKIGPSDFTGIHILTCFANYCFA